MANIDDPIVFARDEANNLIIPLRLARGMEAMLILIRTALLLWRGELWLDLDAGTPWLETTDGSVTERDAILGQAYDPAKTQRAVRREIMAVPGVVDVLELACTFDGAARALTIAFRVRCAFGDSVVTSELATVALAA